MKSILLLLVIVAVGSSGNVPWKPLADGSCAGRCGENDPLNSCQCNTPCSNFGDCCSDYNSICLSCVGRCGEGYLASKPCQCNSACSSNSDCCSDYNNICGGGGGSTETDADVIALSEQLYELSISSLVGDLITYDSTPPGPLFTNVPAAAYSGETISLFLPLRANYHPDTSISDVQNAAQLVQQNAFLDAVMATDVMITLEDFMSSHGMISSPLRDVIEEIFFTNYPRFGSVLGSSGFEHSFMGEIDAGIVKGFHNWISFNEEELAGNLEYTTYINELVIGSNLDVFMMGFNWNGYKKTTDSMWIGSTPELELALYTVCFFHKPNALCSVSMNGKPYKIQTYIQNYSGKELVGSAYPDIS